MWKFSTLIFILIKGWVVTVYNEDNEIYESPMNYPGHSTRGYLPGLKPASAYTTVVRNALTGDEVGLIIRILNSYF